MDFLRRHQGLLLAVTGGLVFALTAPPTDLYPAVLVGLALLAASLSDAPSPARAFGRGVAWGTAAGIMGLRFVPTVIQRFTPLGAPVSYLALVLLAAAQSLPWALGAALTHALERRLRVCFEICFAAGVMVTLLVPTIFAWTPAGLISPWPSFLQLADLIGERGVSSLFALIAALLARSAILALRRAPDGNLTSLSNRLRAAAPRALIAAAALAVLPIHGRWRMASIERASRDLPAVRVGLVNQAAGAHERWDPNNHSEILRKLQDLTRQAEAAGAELTVWPEAAYPYALEHGARWAPRDGRAPLAGGVRGPVLFGLITRAPAVRVGPGIVERNSFNSATIVSSNGELQPTQDKLQLLWFGETVPEDAHLP